MENRQRITLYDQMTSTSNTRSSLASLIQNDAVLSNQKNTNQTLLDIIRENEPNNVVVNVSVTDNNNNSNNVVKDRKSWKAFKELLLFKRRNSEESTHQQQNEDIPTNSDPTEFLPGGEFSDETAQVSMSLMDLLEESEIELERSSDVGDEGDDVEENNEKQEEEEEEKEEEEREDGEGSNVKVEHNCCVCMVRDKGAAFIPCGHTFCRMCSRELWVSRGNCPLCNHFILEVLDIF